jgi:hypothetical protein
VPFRLTTLNTEGQALATTTTHEMPNSDYNPSAEAQAAVATTIC